MSCNSRAIRSQEAKDTICICIIIYISTAICMFYIYMSTYIYNVSISLARLKYRVLGLIAAGQATVSFTGPKSAIDFNFGDFPI